MKNAFCSALKKLGYSYAETKENTIEFVFDDPKTKQPREESIIISGYTEFVKYDNQFLANLYNTAKKARDVITNDPNIINDELSDVAGIAYDWLIDNLSSTKFGRNFDTALKLAETKGLIPKIGE
jgi:hypothetical protein